jgi:hypothetical protein
MVKASELNGDQPPRVVVALPPANRTQRRRAAQIDVGARR